MVYESTFDIEPLGKGKYITEKTSIYAKSQVIAGCAASVARKAGSGSFYREINFRPDIPDGIEKKFQLSENEEAYVIEAIDDKINIYSHSDRGLLYGANTLKALAPDGYLENMLLYDCPVCSVRGLKIYLPGEEGIGYFKEFADMLCYFGYNTIMIEVGGAMEYRRHPEINRKWAMYCNEMKEYSGKTKVIQDKTFKWYKNSIHVENGEGSCLSQEQVKELVKYCRDRHLEVIPEVPLLSHSDYLLLPYPKLAERANDPYPDTYCPSNPDTYKLVFDVIDEVIEVFQPKEMNIGHDEWYSIGICERCRGKSPEKLFADDIIRIHQYLAQRNIKTLMWGDKLVDARKEGKPHGGAETPMFQNYDSTNGEYLGVIPATYKSIDLVPNDLKIINWFWRHGIDYDSQYLSRGMDVVYGNFKGSEFKHWKDRLNLGVQGAIISNWSSFREENLRRNGVLFEMAYGTRMFWDRRYSDDIREEAADSALRKLFAYRNREALRQPDEGRDHAGRTIRVVHTTDIAMDYSSFEDGVFIDHGKYELGRYVITYSDGTKKELPVIYGKNISNCTLSLSSENINPIKEVASAALPVRIGDMTYYECLYSDPYPEDEISGIRIETAGSGTAHLFVREISIIKDCTDGGEAYGYGKA